MMRFPISAIRGYIGILQCGCRSNPKKLIPSQALAIPLSKIQIYGPLLHAKCLSTVAFDPPLERFSSSGGNTKSREKTHHDNPTFKNYNIEINFDFRPKEALEQLVEVSLSSNKNSIAHSDALKNYLDHLSYCILQFSRSGLRQSDSSPSYDLRNFASPSNAQLAVRCLLNSDFKDPSQYRKKVRDLERIFGTCPNVLQTDLGDESLKRKKGIEMTDQLSYLLLKANSRAGNIGRALALLDVRAKMNFSPRSRMTLEGVREDEYIHAVQAIFALGEEFQQNFTPHSNTKSFKGKDPFGENNATLEDPTVWLESILDHMHRRKVTLTTDLANRMIESYAAKGRTARALHLFYKLVQKKRKEDGEETHKNSPQKIVMKVNSPPPKHKVPSKSFGGSYSEIPTGSRVEELANTYMQLSKELELKWSPTITAAFAFAKSLSHGANGHPPIKLNLRSWNNLIKVCCYRGALHRALYTLQHVLPKEERLAPDVYSYNLLMHALARVGDNATQMQLLAEMTSKTIKPVPLTVQALVLGHTNSGDLDTAISLIQDMFNQHNILPPHHTHLRVIEIALARGMVYEAKRHVYFLQQLWKWSPPHALSKEQSQEIENTIDFYRTSPKMGKDALIKLFRYHGEELTENDFF